MENKPEDRCKDCLLRKAPLRTFNPAETATLQLLPSPITLRDYFAGQYLAGILANDYYRIKIEGTPKYAYEMADAMLAERARKSEVEDGI